MNKKPVLPPRRKQTSIAVQTLNNDRKRLWGDYRHLGTWRAFGAKFGVSPNIAYRYVVKGKEPRSSHDRRALGLPVTAPAPVCLRCGVVHLRKCRARNMPAWVSQAADWLAEREKASIP